ncbi:MFS transporter [Marinoscillum pacificum]|uniref:MFS transporter n=1 Tax=Marinoscillum pacificum TaxID=392723 RepID=UPI0021589EDA|nr:MFS transporter [Marinoscillum pacificum]
MKLKDVLILVTLMIIGEVVFILPFVILRIFRPTFLTVFETTNLEIGTAFSAYGIVAMIAYFAGGPIADRFNPKKLIPFALLMTSLGGIWMYTIPSMTSMIVLYAFWGASTILLFWSSFVKAQRILGLQTGQGKSFGLVDAGRGVIAALMAFVAVFLLDHLIPNDPDSVSYLNLKCAFQSIILIFTIFTALCAVLAYFVLEDDQSSSPGFNMKGVQSIVKKSVIWKHAIIVLCAYVGYKCTDDFSLYASDTLHYDDVESARLAAITFWARPVAAVISGIIADKWLTSKTIIAGFIITAIGSALIASGWMVRMEVYLVITLTLTSVAIYGLRGVYYALFEESQLSLKVTGSAAGIVSVIGYTPDIFMGPLMGVILDHNPGALGHQYLFMVLVGFSILGLLVAISFLRNHLATP